METEKLKIINPIDGKGVFEGRQYLSRSEVKDEANYVELALVITKENGEINKLAEVEVKATDERQNKQMNGAGTIFKTFENGKKKEIYCYPFHYEFKTPGKHTIEFSAVGQKIEKVIDVVEDERK